MSYCYSIGRIVGLFYSAILCVWIQPVCAETNNPERVDIFYADDAQEKRVIEGVDISYYSLGKSQSIQNSISLKLPTDLNSAASFMSSYSNSEEGKENIQQIVEGYQGVGKALSLGVKELPAVVIDERFVVYGTTDVLEALDYWRVYMAKMEAK